VRPKRNPGAWRRSGLRIETQLGCKVDPENSPGILSAQPPQPRGRLAAALPSTLGAQAAGVPFAVTTMLCMIRDRQRHHPSTQPKYFRERITAGVRARSSLAECKDQTHE
jgi:hypothetical protein